MRAAPPPASRRPVRVLLSAAVLGLLATACSQGDEAFDSNRPDPSPSKQQVVRTPSPLGTELPYTDPPLVQDLPGASGAAPGEPQPVVPEASPGENTDGGGAPGN